MTLKGKTMAAGTRASLVSLCAACVLAAAVSQASVFVGSAQASDASEDVTNPYTISIPSELSVGSDGKGAMDIIGEVTANHKLMVTASSDNGNKLAGPANDIVAYTLDGGTFTTSAHANTVPINQQVTAEVTEPPRYEGMYTDTVTFTLSCTATHTLTLDAQGGALPEGAESSIELEEGESYNLPTPTCDGYTFNGWYAVSSGGSKVESPVTMSTANVTLYAHWTEHVLTIKYHSGGADRWEYYGGGIIDLTRGVDSVVQVESVKYSAVYPHPPYGLLNVSRLKKDGYHSANASGASDANGVWRVNSPDSAQTVSAGDRPGSPLGWNVAEWIGVFDAFKASDVTVDLYPIFAPNAYSIHYNANGGTGTMSQTVHTYDNPTALRENAFIKDGYTFMGWSDSASGSVQYTDGQTINLVTSPGANITLYAQWQKNTESDEPSNGEMQAASPQINAVSTTGDSPASDTDPGSDATAGSGSVSAGEVDGSFAQKPADTSGDAGPDAGDDVAGSVSEDASEQPDHDASAVSPVDSGVPSSGENAADGAQSSMVDAGDDGFADDDGGVAADETETPAPEPEAVVPVPEAVLENDQPQVAANAPQPESNR